MFTNYYYIDYVKVILHYQFFYCSHDKMNVHLAPTHVVRVLDGDHRGDRVVYVGASDAALHLLQVEGPVRLVLNCTQQHPRYVCCTSWNVETCKVIAMRYQKFQ